MPLGDNPKVLFDFSKQNDLDKFTVRSDMLWGGKSLALFEKAKNNPNGRKAKRVPFFSKRKKKQ